MAIAIPTLENAMGYIGVNFDGVVTSSMVAGTQRKLLMMTWIKYLHRGVRMHMIDLLICS